MLLPNINDAPIIRASLLINQEKSKKGYKSIQSEIAKMVETFGTDFDKRLHKSLFDEIEFKEIKTLINSKSGKIQYFIQEFPIFLDRSDFVSLFSEILMSTENTSTCQEIVDGCSKICKLTYENQMKILMSFILSMNETFLVDAKKLLIAKCAEIEKENKIEQLSQNTLQTLVFILDSFDESELENVNLGNFINSSTNYSTSGSSVNSSNSGNNSNNNNNSNSNMNNMNDLRQLNDIEKMLETSNEEPIEIEKIFHEIGPLMINNNLMSVNCDMLDYAIDEKRLANFILFLIKHQNWVEDKENKYLNKIFLKSINNDAFNTIDDVSDKKTINWNIENMYKMFKTQIDTLDTNEIFTSFDDPKFCIKDKKTFDFFIATLQRLKILNNPTQFYNFIFTKWNNEINQIEFLSFLISNQQNESLSFKNYTGAKVKKMYDTATQVKNVNNMEPWLCIDLVQVLIKLSKGNHYMKVKELFDWPIQNIPEIVILALTSIKAEQDEFLYDELVREILPTFLNNHINSFNIIEEVWNRNKDVVIKTICTLYQTTPDLMNLSRILDIAQKLKSGLLNLVNYTDYSFSVSLAILAVKRDFLHIDRWLKDHLAKGGDDFIDAILIYIKQNVIANSKGNSTNKDNVLEKAQLSLESLGIILDNLLTSIKFKKISQRIENEIKDVYKLIFELFDEIQVPQPNSEEIEQISTGLFNAMYKGETTVNSVIETLVKYQKSIIPKESEIYACMIHCILDEYRFYHQYPEKELTIAGTLFGQVINNKLLDGVIETISLKYILEAIKKGSGPMFNFGKIALIQLIDKIQIWPLFLKTLLETKQIKALTSIYDKLNQKYNDLTNNPTRALGVLSSNDDFYRKERKGSSLYYADTEEQKFEDELGSNLLAFQESTSAKQGKDNNSNSNNNNDSVNNTTNNEIKSKTKLTKPTQFNNSGNISQLLGHENIDPITSPAQDVIDNMKLILNSLGKNNINDKSKELKQLLSNEQIIRWFSNFFIINRVSSENNFHQIYNELITLIDNKDLNKLLIKDTIFFIKKLLQSESLDKEVKEKNVLKNLGSWLGIMTLAKNKPILAKDLDLKETIFDAYEKGKLGGIIIFIVRIIEHSLKTKVFHHKNPWIQAILSLLAELYAKSNLKQSLKFEIENLFKKLEQDLSNYPQSNLLEKLTVCNSSQDFTKQKNSHDSIDITISMKDLYMRISNLDTYINDILTVINTKKDMSYTKQDIVKPLAKILHHSICEIFEPIVERAVSISGVTVKELILKDFMYEKDPMKFKTAACSSIKSLAGSLAIITSKEPLRAACNSQLKEFFAKKLDNDQIELITNQSHCELLDIGCIYIQNYVIKKAIEKIQSDTVIMEEIEKRKSNQKFEPNEELVTKIQELPDGIRPNADGLTTEQYKIYEQLDKTVEIYARSELIVKHNNFLEIIMKLLKEVMDSAHSNTQKISKNYEVCMVNIQSIAPLDTSDVYDDEEQLTCLERVLVDSGIDNESISLDLALLSFKYSITAAKIHNMLLLNVYSQLLKGWIKIQPEISKEITFRVLTFDDIFVRFNEELHYYFYRKKIFFMQEYEKGFIEFLNCESKCEIAQQLLFNLYQKNSDLKFQNIPSYMYDSHGKNYLMLFSFKSKLASLFSANCSKIIDYKVCNIKDEVTFKKFSDLCYNGLSKSLESFYPFKDYTLDKMKAAYEFMTAYFFINDDRMVVFIMLITELCIKNFFHENKPINSLYPETEAWIIFRLLSYLNTNASTKDNIISSTMIMKVFHNIIFGIFRTFHQDYLRSGITFNQRPYYKLLNYLIVLINNFEGNDHENLKLNFLMTIADLLIELYPMNYPGFALAWLDLISSKHFVSNFLSNDSMMSLAENITKYEKYLALIVNILSYLKSFSNEIISDNILKVLLDNVYKFMFLLSRTYPEFISGYYFMILVALPSGSNFIQMKNIILSSIPNDIEKIDPNIDQTALKQSSNKKNAVILFNIQIYLQDNNFKSSIDSYLETKAMSSIEDLLKRLLNNKRERDWKYYNINAIVIYIGQIIQKMFSEKKVDHNDILRLFMMLMKGFDNENRDHLIHSIINELRYISFQTRYFSFLFISLFTDIKDDFIEEHMLKTLLERLIYKPLPWGVIFTINQLFKNAKYGEMQKSYMSKNRSDIIEKIKANANNNSKEQMLANYFYMK